jgi:hypothetical protein
MGPGVFANLSTNATMSCTVGSSLDTWPEVCELSRVHAAFDHKWRCHHAGIVADLALNAVIVDLVAGPQGVGVVCERPILDTVELSSAIAAKTKDWVQDVRYREGASLPFFVPVPRIVNRSTLKPRE